MIKLRLNSFKPQFYITASLIILSLIFLPLIVYPCLERFSVDYDVLKIRKEFESINSRKDFTIVSKELNENSCQNALLSTFCKHGNCRKIVATYKGELGMLVEEYYLNNNKLMFVCIKKSEYNRPIFWTCDIAKHNNDTECHNSEKTVLTCEKFFFNNNENIIKVIDGESNELFDRPAIQEIGSNILKEYCFLKSKI